MANGADTFDVIKDILDKDVLDDSDAHRLLLAGITDLNEKLDTREKEQKKYNEKTDKMWSIYKVNVGILMFLGSSFGGLVWGLITGAVTIHLTGE